MKRPDGFIVSCIAVFVLLTSNRCANEKAKEQAGTATQFVCTPCGSDCDTTIHAAPGTCGHCNMKLVEKSTVVFNKVEPEKLCNYITSKGEKNVVLLDVRTPAEYNGTAEEKFGRLQNAINIPVQNLEERISELEKYKDKEIVVYCSHSHRSPRASYMLNQKGFKKVTNMQGGMSVWKDKVKDNECSKKLYVQQ